MKKTRTHVEIIVTFMLELGNKHLRLVMDIPTRYFKYFTQQITFKTYTFYHLKTAQAKLQLPCLLYKDLF